MQPRRTLPAAAVELARRQSGVLSRTQATQLGLSARVLQRLTSDWDRLGRGVYYLGRAVGDAPWSARVWGGILLGGDGARAGMLTAAVLDGLAGADERIAGQQSTDEITILVQAKVHPRAGFRFVRETAGLRLPSPSSEPTRTRIEDTVVDLCAHGDDTSVVTWLTRACQRRLTTPDRLRRRASERGPFRHRLLVLDILGEVRLGATSTLELRALRHVLRPHGLPRVQLQRRTGARGRVADAAFVEFGVLVEFDGRIGHAEEGAFRDMERDNLHVLDGWVTLRFGWWDVVNRPCAVAAQIARLLQQRGWSGALAACARCC
jgi:very-short-patch-repair endonuclease